MVTKQAFKVAADENLVCDGYLMKKLAGGALVWLEQNHEHVNRLNVFPVPDGDTGTNMLLTMREAYGQIEPMQEVRVDKIAAALAYGALNGARGNSGTILSQLWQGFAEGLKGHAVFDSERFAQACKRGVEMAYKAVSTPVEGTILTVAREATEAVVERVEADGEVDLVAVLKSMLLAARVSLRKTPELLPVLRQAGVVDSGGQGFVYILEGMLHAATGKTILPTPKLVELTIKEPNGWQQALEPDNEEGYGYDVQFRMHGQNLDVGMVRKAMEEMGWSTCVVGDQRLVKVHVHVHDPGKPITYAVNLGVEIDDVVVENMQMQYRQYVQQREAREEASISANTVAVIAVAPGSGLRRLFEEELGAARVVSGGQTMNPSTGDFLDAIKALPNKEIVLLPNNKNIILAAQQAANMMPDRNIRVVPSRTIPQGISAMVAYSNLMSRENADEAAEEMKDALSQIISAEVTTATRSVDIGGVSVREGQLIGLVEGSLVVAGSDMVEVMRELLHKAEADKRELVTLYYGNDTHKARAQALVEALAQDFPAQTFEIVYGGQALYPYIISIE